MFSQIEIVEILGARSEMQKDLKSQHRLSNGICRKAFEDFSRECFRIANGVGE